MKLVFWPADILKRTSLPVLLAPDPQLLGGMYQIMKAYGGAGLSAVQVGILQRIVTIDTGALQAPKFFINPVITAKKGDKAPKREGCLSIPGYFDDILRYPEVTLTYHNEKMELQENVPFTGLVAHVLQHECEHLDGITMMDHLTAAKRSQILGQMMALRRAGKLKLR